MKPIDKVNLLLLEHGMSGAELCREIGVSDGVYSQWNKGRSNISPKNLKKIADFFHVSVSYLLDDEDNKKTATDGDGKNLVSDKDKQFIDWFRSLSPEKQKAILISQDAPEGLL